MQQIIQPTQIVKIISGHFLHNITEAQFAIIYTKKIVVLYNGEERYLIKSQEQIIDAIKMFNATLGLDTFGILCISGKITQYNCYETKQSGFTLDKKNHFDKKTSKIYSFDNELYICDHIRGITCFNIQTLQCIKLPFKIQRKILHICKIKDELYIFYQKDQYLFIQTRCSNKTIQTNIKINCEKIVFNENYLIIYSENQFRVFYSIDFKEVMCCSDLYSQNIIDIYIKSKQQIIIIFTNGEIQIVTIFDKFKSNCQVLDTLQLQNIYLTNSYDQFIALVSANGITIYNYQTKQIQYNQKVHNFMTHLFQFNNNLMACKEFNNYSELFQIKQVKSTGHKQLLPFNQQNNIIQSYNYYQQLKGLQIINETIILIYKNIIQVYKNILTDEIQYETKHFCTMKQDKYLIIADSNKITLITINKESKIQLLNEITIQISILRQLTQDQFTIYDSQGFLYILEISQDTFQIIQKSQQYYQLSQYYISNDKMVLAYFDQNIELFSNNGLQQLQLNQNIETQKYKLNSIASEINFDSTFYIIITQIGEILQFNQQLQLISKFIPFFNNSLIDSIQQYENEFLIQVKQGNQNRISLYDSQNEFEIDIQQNEKILVDNYGQYYLLDENNIYTFESFDEPQYSFIDIQFNMFNQILLIKDQFIICKQSIYLIENDKLIQLKQFSEEITKVEIEQNKIAIILNEKQLLILKYQNNKIKELNQLQLGRPHQNLKLTKNILILTSYNEITLYSLQKLEKLLQFKAIFPDKDVVYEENIILQIHIECHTDEQLMFDVLIDQAGIAIIIIKLNNTGNQIAYKLSKKYHSPNAYTYFSRMQMIKNQWITFNLLNECQIFQQVNFFFGCSLSPISKSQINDIVVDSTIYKDKIYYLGIAGALWNSEI